MSRSLMQLLKNSDDFTREFGVSRETLERLKIYAALLREWQRAINLVAPSTLEEMWLRHFADSAQLLRLVPAKADLNWLDFGAGAGFPGLVAAIMLGDRGSGPRVVLVESDAKKGAFLREVVRQTGISGLVTVDIVIDRIESAAISSKVIAVDVISARALAKLDKLFELGVRFFGPTTVGLFPKGRDVSSELAIARQSWHFSVDLVPSLTDSGAAIVMVRDLCRVR